MKKKTADSMTTIYSFLSKQAVLGVCLTGVWKY